MNISSGFATVRFAVAPSRMLLQLVAVASAASVLAVAAAAIAVVLKVLLSAMLLLWVWYFSTPVLYPPVQSVIADRSGLCVMHGGNWIDVRLLPDTYISSWLIVLRFRADSAPLSCLCLLPDSADPDALRRLRVWLRWHARSADGSV